MRQLTQLHVCEVTEMEGKGWDMWLWWSWMHCCCCCAAVPLLLSLCLCSHHLCSYPRLCSCCCHLCCRFCSRCLCYSCRCWPTFILSHHHPTLIICNHIVSIIYMLKKQNKNKKII